MKSFNKMPLLALLVSLRVCGGTCTDSNTTITSCSGPPTNQAVCTDRVDPDRINPSPVDPEILCLGTDSYSYCDWNEEFECVLSENACDSEIGQSDCERLGCNWTETLNNNSNCSSGVMDRPMGGISLFLGIAFLGLLVL